MNTAYLLLGSNLGNRESYLSQAIELIEKSARKIIATSSLYNTAPWGNTEQNDFLNQVVCVETKLSAEELLRKILSIEKKMGRIRSQKSKVKSQKWQSRIIDIDILFFNQNICTSVHLQIPHPHLHERRFALVPLAEIARNFIHPVFKKPVKQLLKECKDKLTVEKKVLPNGEDLGGALPFFISIEGNIGAGKTTLAKILAKELNASVLLEKFDENPHLEKFYENPKQYALQVELWFLKERHVQIKEFFARQTQQFNNSAIQQLIISDYHISKCLIFAKTNLKKKEFMLYEKSYNIIEPLLPPPDLLIYLHQDINQLKKNIAKRGRTYEKKISASYLNKIQKGYESYLKSRKSKKVHIIECNKFDFLHKKNIKSIISVVKSTMGY